MQIYDAPLRDMRFVLHELHGLDRMRDGFPDLGPELVDSVLEEAARFASEVLLPLNAPGDEGCRLENGVVRTPAGFRDAYDAYREGGWPSLAGDPAHGGQGLPECVAALVKEIVCSANLSFSLYPGLTRGATEALSRHGSEALKEVFLGKLVAGIWSGTMCLTEPHCGTDLGLLRTRAEPDADGTFRINGTKIFISGGEHDLTENIIHLVLARLPGAPPGIKGISMFLVPKFLPGADGRPGARNGLACTSLEHKMGLRACATCQISFDDATGWLVGAPHRGMQAMFTMMNEERLSVGIQGLGLSAIVYQEAVAYAKDRLQGRSLSGAKRPDLAADPIIVHPDIRRTLMTIRATTEGCRALGIWVAQAVDLSTHAATATEREEAADFVALMTPIVKALFTDLGFENASHALQVHGGHGYIREHGIEQHVRDARIAMLYEGTNGIQALDLVMRKLPAQTGRLLRRFFHPVGDWIEANKGHARIGRIVVAVERAFGALQLATATIGEKGVRDPEEGGAAATEYLRLFGLVAMGFVLARSAAVAADRLAGGTDETSFYEAKIITAQFFADRVLPGAGALLAAIRSGKASTMALDEMAF